MNIELWEKAVAFHGHECPGLAIGVRACEAAMQKMNIDPAKDEEIVCVTENDACGVDAVQTILGCSVGKGNLLFKDTGKMAFIFMNRANGNKMRFYMIGERGKMEFKEYQQFILDAPIDVIFKCNVPTADIPERARLFSSVICEKCGESAPEHKIRLMSGKKVCLDCFGEYDRGWF